MAKWTSKEEATLLRLKSEKLTSKVIAQMMGREKKQVDSKYDYMRRKKSAEDMRPVRSPTDDKLFDRMDGRTYEDFNMASPAFVSKSTSRAYGF